MVNAAFVLRASGPVNRDPDVEADGVPLDAPAWSLIDPASTGSVRDPALSLSRLRYANCSSAEEDSVHLRAAQPAPLLPTPASLLSASLCVV